MSAVRDLERRPEATPGYPTRLVQSVGEVGLRELWQMLWRRKAVIVATALTVSILALLVILQLTPLYTATTSVMIGDRTTQVVNVEAVLSGLSADIETIESQIQVVRSRGLAEKTIEKLSLDQNPEFNGALRPPSPLDHLFDVRRYLPDSWVNALLGPPEQEMLSEEERARRQLARMIDTFLSKLAVVPEGRSRVIKISFTSEGPQTAAAVVNTLADFYIVAQLEAKFEATKRANEWLSDRVAELREQVQASERAAEEYRSQSGLLKTKDSTLATQEISELSSQLVLARSERAAAEARLRQLEELVASPEGATTAPEVLQSALISALKQQLAEVERRAAELSQEYGDRHPRMINVRAEISDLRAKISAEVNKIIQGIRNEVAVTQAREASLTTSLNQLKAEVAELNRAEVQLRALEREAQANRTLLETFLGRYKETSAQENFQQPDASIISAAAVPEDPAFPDKKLLFALSVAVAGFIGVMLAFALEQLDSGIRSMEQIEQMMGVAPLGLIPVLKGVTKIGKRPEDYILEKPASAYGESIRSLYTNILLSDVDRQPKVIMIASSIPKEGKTSVTVSLARLLASVDKKVIVVDCDLRRPATHKAFDAPARPGIVECLAGKVSLEEVVHRDRKSGAHLLPAGGPAPNPPDLLGSTHMRKLLKALGDAYDVVIVDSAPVNAVSDTRVLSRLVDKTVYLVRWEETRREVAIGGLKQLLNAGSDVAGAALTMVDVKQHAHYGYSDSGYYYGPVKKYYTG